MPAMDLPGIGLDGFAPLGEHNWNTWMDENLLVLSVLLHLRVRSRTASPIQGAINIVPVGSANARNIAVHVNGSWKYISPIRGMRAYVDDEEGYVTFDGTNWRRDARLPQYTSIEMSGGGAIPEAALRAGSVVIINSAADAVISVPELPATTPADLPNGSTFVRQPTTIIQTGAGKVSISPGSAGVTLNSPDGMRKLRAQFSAVSIVPVGANSYVLAGDLTP